MNRAIRSFCVSLLLVTTHSAHAQPITVHFAQGSSHGFVTLETLAGKTLATGENTQTVHGDRVTSRLVFHFRDGSVDDHLTVSSQRDFFRLISDHHIQHGPSLPKSMDFLINATTGEITNRADDGKVSVEHLALPPDVSNGLPPNLLLNINPSTPETKISYVVPGAQPRLIRVPSNLPAACLSRLDCCAGRPQTSHCT